jgi:uncharacterized membrane protein HdeD (DUF308 family)
MTDAAIHPSNSADGLPNVPWWLIVGLGALSIIAGILAVVWPGATLLLIALTFGIFLIMSGLGDIIGAVQAGAAPATVRVLFGFLGVLALAAGVILLARPAASLLTAAWVLGLWFAISGIVQLVQGFVASQGRAWNIMFGVIGLVAGVIILAKPSVGISTLILIVSISFIVRGMVTVAVGLVVRKAAQTA